MDYIILAIIITACLIFFVKASKNKSKYGVNLKRVYCPVCHTKQPVVRMPANFSQALYGGTTCLNCHANLDKYGDVIQ